MIITQHYKEYLTEIKFFFIEITKHELYIKISKALYQTY